MAGYRHRNWPDHEYKIVAEGEVQARKPLTEGERVMIYQNVQDGTVWVRRKTEFFDGRFTEIV